VLLKRGLSYEQAAAQIRRQSGRRISRDHFGNLVRGGAVPGLALAKAIVRWVGNPRELKLADLIELE
jgi:hypothetical protein